MTELRRDLAAARWERWAAGTGAAFAVVALIAFLIVPDAPTVDDSNDEILSFFAEEDTRLFWQAFVFGIAAVLFLWFIGTLASALRRAEGDPAGRIPGIVVASGATSAGIYLVGLAAYTALASGADENIDAASGRALFELGGFAFTITDFAAATFVLAASLGIARTALLPTWISWAGIAVALYLLIDAFGRTIGDAEVFGPGGVLGIIAFLAFLAWVLVTSVWLLLRTAPARTT